MTANLVFKNGFFQTQSRSFNVDIIQQGFFNFLNQEMSYKKQFLQKVYNYGFDGYSYMGQEDSSNQYASDLLHSFVISDFQNYHNFPNEFHPFFTEYWSVLQNKVREIEVEVIHLLNIDGLADFYRQHIGHMVSCNFYPETETTHLVGKDHTRLSAHTDVSLFTIFPFGFDSDFQFQDRTGQWVHIPATSDIIVFPGYLLEVFTHGEFKALNHKVAMPMDRQKERFSFAYFSLPYPKQSFKINGRRYTSESYFELYLSLF